MYVSKIIPLDIYATKIQLIITSNHLKTVNNIYKKHNTGMVYTDSMEGCMIGLSINKYHLVINAEYLTYNTVMHELYHLVRAIGGDRSINDEESLAWLQGKIAQDIFTFFKQKNLKIS